MGEPTAITMRNDEWQALRQKVNDRLTLSHDEAADLLYEAERAQKKFMRQIGATSDAWAERARYKAFVDDVLREASEYPPIGTAWIAWAHETHLGETDG